MKNKDQRTRLMSEILNNIRSIKLYSWEDAFVKKLFAIRNDKELVLLRKMGYLSSLSTCLWSLIPFLVSFSTFAVYAAASGRTLTSQIVFPAISLFQLLSFPLSALPVVLTAAVEAWVSVTRISSFLSAKELQSDAVDIRMPATKPTRGDELVTITKGDFAWNSSAQAAPTLHDINLSVKKGELVAVVGRVGSGKSSLLSAILGEMTKLDGSVQLKGTVAYVPQSPWIVGGELVAIGLDRNEVSSDLLSFPRAFRHGQGEYRLWASL
jgi:ATP-binding cassette subfamily C (CFTR/MRP) protein 1